MFVVLRTQTKMSRPNNKPVSGFEHRIVNKFDVQQTYYVEDPPRKLRLISTKGAGGRYYHPTMECFYNEVARQNSVAITYLAFKLDTKIVGLNDFIQALNSMKAKYSKQLNKVSTCVLPYVSCVLPLNISQHHADTAFDELLVFLKREYLLLLAKDLRENSKCLTEEQKQEILNAYMHLMIFLKENITYDDKGKEATSTEADPQTNKEFDDIFNELPAPMEAEETMSTLKERMKAHDTINADLKRATATEKRQHETDIAAAEHRVSVEQRKVEALFDAVEKQTFLVRTLLEQLNHYNVENGMQPQDHQNRNMETLRDRVEKDTWFDAI
jgi:hypothetical protein